MMHTTSEEALLEALVGDAVGFDYEAANLATQALTEITKGGLSLAKSEDDKKKAKEKQSLTNDYQAEQAKADAAQGDANSETNPMGPKHAAARAAAARAAAAKQLLLQKYPDALSGLSSSSSPPTDRGHGGGGGNFLTKVWHGVPVWGWAVGGAGVATGLVFVLKALFRRRK